MKPVKIVQDTDNSKMFWLEWEDGVKSEYPYNESRARDILKHYDYYTSNMERSERMLEENGLS